MMGMGLGAEKVMKCFSCIQRLIVAIFLWGKVGNFRG